MPLSVQFMLLGFCIASGFVSAGLAGSLYQLVTSEPARFRLLGPSVPAVFLTFLFCAVSGPFIIMRNAIAMARKEADMLVWLLGSALIAGMWSACSGLLLLDFVLAARAGL